MNIPISMLFILFLVYSFLGWFMEVCVAYYSQKKFINRGFLIGPVCPIYGLGAILIMVLLHRYLNDPIVMFVMAILVCSFLEYFTGYIMEKLFKARWWDYSSKKFNINGRICLDNLLAFGILALLVMYLVNPFLVGFLEKVNIIILNVVAIVLAIIFVTDIGISLKIISGFKNVAKSVRKDNTEEITNKVREMLLNRGGLYKRLVSAFNFEASIRLIKDFRKRLAISANEAISILENEKNKRIKQLSMEYDEKITELKREVKSEQKQNKDKIKKLKENLKKDREETNKEIKKIKKNNKDG